MSRVSPNEILEAEDLLEELDSWSDEEIEELPVLYQKKAREYRDLLKDGDG